MGQRLKRRPNIEKTWIHFLSAPLQLIQNQCWDTVCDGGPTFYQHWLTAVHCIYVIHVTDMLHYPACLIIISDTISPRQLQRVPCHYYLIILILDINYIVCPANKVSSDNSHAYGI